MSRHDRLHHAAHRFNPLDKRCGINLDEIDPAQWKVLEDATNDYIEASKDRFQELADLLLSEAPESGKAPTPISTSCKHSQTSFIA